MVKTKFEIEKIVQDFIDILKGVFFINEVYLFGSYARKSAEYTIRKQGLRVYPPAAESN